MSIRKKCPCPNPDRCTHTRVAEFQRKLHGVSTLFTIRVDDYAALRGHVGHVKSDRDARQWESRMIDDVKAGRDPRKPPTLTADGATVGSVIADYTLKRVPGYDVQATVLSELRHVGGYFGADRPIGDLSDLPLVRGFESALTTGWRPDAADGTPTPALPHGRGIVAVHRILARLRHVLRWAQDEKLFSGVVPFGRNGIKIDADSEPTRDRRLLPGEWEKLMRACRETDTARYRFIGRQMLRRLVGAVELAPRATNEILGIRVPDVDYLNHVVTIRHTKSGKPRKVPYNPNGDAAIVLESRRHLEPGPDLRPGKELDHVFGDEDGHRPKRFSAAMETILLVAFGPRDMKGRPLARSTKAGRRALRAIAKQDGQRLQFRDLRREAASRWNDQGVDDKTKMVLLGHTKLTTTQKYLSLNDGKSIADRVGARMGWSEKRPKKSAKSLPNDAAGMLRRLASSKG